MHASVLLSKGVGQGSQSLSGLRAKLWLDGGPRYLKCISMQAAEVSREYQTREEGARIAWQQRCIGIAKRCVGTSCKGLVFKRSTSLS